MKDMKDNITYESAQREIAQHSGIQLVPNIILEEELISTMPLVYRANALAKEFKRNVQFEILLVSPEMRGSSDGPTEIWIKAHNIREDTYFLWEKSRFMNRYFRMQEMYECKIEGEDWNLTKKSYLGVLFPKILTTLLMQLLIYNYFCNFLNKIIRTNQTIEFQNSKFYKK
uniref:DUF5739 domain-containing protein n=1 Tax=Heterorhabditis bacteriophora TaxID=37862 RepID=A0A1I7WJT5_HETBA